MEIILLYDAEQTPSVVLHAIVLYAFAVVVEAMAPPLESPPCAEDGAEVAPFPIYNKCLEGCEIVEEPPPPHNAVQIAVGQVLVEHREVVAEVEEGLHRVRLRQCAATHMVDFTLREAEDALSHPVKTPAEVYLLVVGKEPSVESSGAPVIGGAYEQTGTGGPQHLLRVIVLAVVVLHRVENLPRQKG